MPSFFKNIKKLFSKPNHSNVQKNPAKISHRAEQADIKSTQQQRPERHIKQQASQANPYMDEARVQSIKAVVIDETVHQINARDIDNNATKIIRELHRAQYESYLVGGCVRDLLLNKRPKDFDVTTGAHPEQAHKVFSRSRLIGRRFKLLHVRFGRELIEVATFRASHDSSSEESQAKQADSGVILRDNVYGTIDQDAMRRDFTINALYYDIKSRSIYDFTNGFADIAARQVRMIGDPNERYREDPVRMLRAVRFAAKLDFEIEEKTAAPIVELSPMLFDIAPARLFDEVLKLLQSGHGNASLKLLQQYRLLETILPQSAQALDNDLENACQLIHNALKNTDRRIKQRKSVSPGFLYAVLLWPSVHNQLKKLLAKKRIPPLTALHEVSSKVILEQIKRTSIPKRFSTNIREIWELQLRLTGRPGSKANQLLEHPRFRAAYDLLVLREKSGEDLDNISAWWTDYQPATAQEKEAMVKELNNRAPVKKKRAPVKHSVTEKPVFEKFDVVEQAKPKSKARLKKTADNQSEFALQVSDQTVVNESQLTTVEGTTETVEAVEISMPLAAENTDSVASIHPKIAAQPEPTPPLRTAYTLNSEKINDSSGAQQKPEISAQPVSSLTIEQPAARLSTEVVDAPAIATDAQSTLKDALQGKQQPIPSRIKPRRSRAKNDPRNT